MTSPATEKGYHTGREPANKGKAYPLEVLTPDEVGGLIEACPNRAPTGIRNRALIVTMYRGGLRAGEALALRPNDMDTTAGTLTVLHGKGYRRRVVGLDPGATAVLSRWLEARHNLGINGHARLFLHTPRQATATLLRTHPHAPPREQGRHREARPPLRPASHPRIRTIDGGRARADHAPAPLRRQRRIRMLPSGCSVSHESSFDS
jgi:integrase